jgi:hypothetical protein
MVLDNPHRSSPTRLVLIIAGAGVLALGAQTVEGAPVSGTPNGVPFAQMEALITPLDASLADLTAAVESGTEVTRPNLGPRRASDLVALIARGSPCATTGPSGQLLDRRVTAAGEEEPFTVPAGKVLVVTGLTWRSVGNTAHAGATIRLEPPGTIATAFFDTRPALADGFGGGHAEISGLAVGAGVGICIANSGDSAGAPSGMLYGYLADAE